MFIPGTVIFSRGHEKSVCAAHDIAKGCVVWGETLSSYRIYAVEEYVRETSTPSKKSSRLIESSFPQEVFINGQILRFLCRNLGPGSYIRHNGNPNLVLNDKKDALIAVRDIREGELLTRDYLASVSDWQGWKNVRHCAEQSEDYARAA